MRANSPVLCNGLVVNRATYTVNKTNVINFNKPHTRFPFVINLFFLQTAKPSLKDLLSDPYIVIAAGKLILHSCLLTKTLTLRYLWRSNIKRPFHVVKTTGGGNSI